MKITLRELNSAMKRLDNKWHTSRALRKSAKLIASEIRKNNTPSRNKFREEDITVFISSTNRFKVTNKNKIANIIERGFKGYHYGKRVLNNPRNKVKGVAPYRYKVMKIKDKLLGKDKFVVLSEQAILKNPQKWRMPARKGERYMQNALIKNRAKIRADLTTAVLKDALNQMLKGLAK